MAVYMINLVRDVMDREAIERYWSRVGATYADNGKPLVAYTPFEMIEGTDVPVWGVVLVEFPSMRAARDWYFGPEYQEVKKLRAGAMDIVTLFAEAGFVAAADRRPPAGFVPPAHHPTPAP
jgi:uncharacterized protein (DUF1330 family)